MNDRTIGAAVAAGAVDLERVVAACRAGGQCGGCHPTIERILECEAIRAESVSVRRSVA